MLQVVQGTQLSRGEYSLRIQWTKHTTDPSHHASVRTQPCRHMLQADVITAEGLEDLGGGRHMLGNESKTLHNISNIRYGSCFHKRSDNTLCKCNDPSMIVTMSWMYVNYEKMKRETISNTAPFSRAGPLHSHKSRKSSPANSAFWQVSPWGVLSELSSFGGGGKAWGS